MTLYTELQTLLAELSRGTKSVSDLRSWLEDHVDEVMESDDERLMELDGLAWTLIGELDRGDRDESSVQSELGVVTSLR
jgi:hypothetical protein